MDPSSVNELNGYDKLYLLMFKWRIIRLFNPLCYAAGVKSVKDLERQILTNLDHVKKKLPSWAQSPSFDDDLESIQNMIEDSKTVKYEDLPELLGIQKNNYKEKLEAAGVSMIQKDCVSLQTKIALGRPYSGDVYNAQLTQGHNKIDVVLRYDLGPAQRESFIREAKLLAGLQHEYIMKCFGVVILGSYTDSVALVVELFSKGNLEELSVPSLFHAWLYASQLSSALEYLESKHLVHTSVVEPFVYIASLEKISLGGFMCCCHEEEIGKTQPASYHVVTGHQGHCLDDNSLKGVVAMFAHLVIGMFRYLDSHRSGQLLKLFPNRDKMWPLVCPSGVVSLLNQCLDEDVNKRPAFQEIHQILAKERPVKLGFTTSNSSAEVRELSYEEGDKVWVISQNVSSYHGWWFGQKENGTAGFFERAKAKEIDDDDQVPHEIRARGSAAELAYNIALLEGKVKVCRARLLIIGQDRAGKTSLKKSLIGLPFNPVEPSTEVLEMNSSKLEVNIEQVVEWKAISDDTEVEQVRPEDLSIARLVVENMMQKKENNEGQISPGKEKEKEMGYEKDVAGAAQPNGMQATGNPSAMPSLTRYISTSKDLVDGFQENLPQMPKMTMPKELAPLVSDCLKSPNSPSSPDSAAETVLEIWDFAGQHLYYATHPIFFSHRAIYLLVHNLTRNPNDLAEPSFKCGDHILPLQNFCNETNLDMLSSWLVSVHSIRRPPTDEDFIETWKSNLHCLPPPVLMVGTHADQVSAQRMSEVESQIASSMKGKTYQEHVLGPFYRVDNTESSNSPAVKEIQTRVQQLISSGLNSTANLPVKWFNFEKVVKKLAGETFFMTLEEISQVAKQECFIDDDKQLDAMLNYYHDLGLIVRFSDTVVLNIQWLINLFKKLITTCPFQEQDPVDRKLWQELEETGVLHIQLINKVFEDLHGSGKEALRHSVLDMMEKFGFVAKFHHHHSNSSEIKYFVPAQLRVSDLELWKLAPQESDPCCLIFNFCNGFVPHGLFPQLVSHLIALSPKLECFKDPKLYCNGAHFFLGKKSQFDLILLCSKHCLKLVFKGYDTDNEQGVRNSLAVQVRTVIEQELERLCKQWHWLGNVYYDVCISCLACLSSVTCCKRHKSALCLDQDCMHLLPISAVAIETVTLFTCPEQVGEHSRFTLPNLHKWYSSNTSEEKPPTNDQQLAKIEDVDIVTLADKIPVKWKIIGRLLGLKDNHIDQIEIDNKGYVYEQCYAMLKAWRENQPDSTSTCEQLKKALSHEIVMKKDLVQIFCYKKPPANDQQLAKIEDVDIMTLADKIPVKWKIIGEGPTLNSTGVTQASESLGLPAIPSPDPGSSEEKKSPTAPIAEAVQDVKSSSVVTSNGGSVSVKGVKLICPPGAVDDPVSIKLILEETYKYCGLIVNHGLENDLTFGAPIINCQPNGHVFKKHVKFVIAVDSERENSIEAFLVLHGTPSEGRKIHWEDVTRNSKFDLENKELSVNIDHFSLIAVLVRLAWIQTKEIATRLNLISFKYMLSVLCKRRCPNLPYGELAFVFMSRDIYREQSYREHDDCALMKLKSDGFEELCSNVRVESGFIYNNENLRVSVHLGEDYKPASDQQERITVVVDSSVWWSTGHVVKLSLQASGTDAKILCGRIVVEGQHGHVEEDHFCQQDLCGYVRRLLGIKNAIFNIKPLTLKLGLSKETLNEAITCEQSEAKQLGMILLRWREAHKNTDDFAVLRKALEGLQPEDYRVKERGQMHIEHLRELAVTIVGLLNKDPCKTKYLELQIKTLCSSILRDCCIEMATSKKDLDLATSTENCASLLESYRQIRQIPADMAEKCQLLFKTREESTILEDFLVIVPQLVQAIKEIFRDEKVPPQQSGLRGVGDKTALKKMVSNIQEAVKGEKLSRLFCEVSYILEHLCLNNNGNRSTENEIHQWGSSNMIITMLQFLEQFFQSSEEKRLFKRLHLFSFNIRDVMSNPEDFERNFLRDFHNVVLSLLKFAKFDPSQLVRFELSDPINSCHTQGNYGLKYDKLKETFSQEFWIIKESDDELQLEAIAHVHIHGCIRSIGAFESLITLPVACSTAIDRLPIDSLSVVVRREHDDSRNLHITLYGTQKEKISNVLKYLQNELGADVVDLSQTDIAPSHLKMRSFAKAGTQVSLRLVHKWESEKLVIDSDHFVTLADSAAGGASVPHPEMAAEVNQLALMCESTALPVASDSAVANYSRNFVMDPSNAELIQRHLHEQRGHIEFHYHQTFQRGHVCVAGENTSLNMHQPRTEQRSLEAGPGGASYKCLTAGTGAHKV